MWIIESDIIGDAMSVHTATLSAGISRTREFEKKDLAERGVSLENIRRIARHLGIFGRYNVQGFQYEGRDGRLCWLITAWPGGDSVRSYWVENETMHDLPKIRGGPGPWTFEVGKPIHGMLEEERQSILAAIKQWGSSET